VLVSRQHANVSVVTHWTAENQMREFKSGFIVMYVVDGFILSASTLKKTCSAKCLVTQVTFVRFLSTVNSAVLNQVV